MTTHPKTTATYRPNREASEQIIRMLCEHYPKCFFDDPRQRRPLKQDIVADIIKDKALDVSAELLNAAVEYYKNHIGYKGYQMSIPGTKRIDLNGEAAGTVTEAEEIVAQQLVDEFHKTRNEQQAAKEAGMNDDYTVVRRLVAPTLGVPKSKSIAQAPEFAPLYEALASANTTVNAVPDPAMRTVVARAVLDMVIQKAQTVRKELEETQ